MALGRLRQASGAPPGRSFRSIASVIISAIVSLVTKPTNLPAGSVMPTAAAEFCCISLSACPKLARQPTVRTADAVMASATRIRPCVFHRLKDVGTIERPDETSVAFNHGKRPLRGLQKDVYSLVDVCLGLKG